jgi:hypothetical protein
VCKSFLSCTPALCMEAMEAMEATIEAWNHETTESWNHGTIAQRKLTDAWLLAWYYWLANSGDIGHEWAGSGSGR